jgi:hypothetical protein
MATVDHRVPSNVATDDTVLCCVTGEIHLTSDVEVSESAEMISVITIDDMARRIDTALRYARNRAGYHLSTGNKALFIVWCDIADDVFSTNAEILRAASEVI